MVFFYHFVFFFFYSVFLTIWILYYPGEIFKAIIMAIIQAGFMLIVSIIIQFLIKNYVRRKQGNIAGGN
jgi:hypothetical protein